MAEEEAGSEDRTEEATSQRREDFRRRGQVVQSRELASVFFLFGAALALWGLGRFFLEQFIEIFNMSFGEHLVAAARTADFTAVSKFAAVKGLMVAAPALGIAALLGFMASVVQVGFLYNEDAVQFDFSRMDPVSGFRRLFSLRAVVEGAKAFIKVSLVAAISFVIIRDDILLSPLMSQFGVSQIMIHMSGMVLKILFGVGMFMFVLAVMDYGYLWWDLEKKMKMTKQEVKEEHKSREGDPLIKARIRKIQRDLATRRMMDAVPKAEVIITNPTHIAVALAYEADMPSPKIVAMGADLVAEKIRKIATEHGIPLVENKPLARTIYKTLKIGQFIPRELFNAVAEVLAYVYRLKKKVLR
jgi:flagellar biosynthetic protein FlhB